LSPILFNLYNEYLTSDALEGSGDFRIGGHVIRTVKYADDLALLAEGEKVLQGMNDRRTETRRCRGMEANVDKTKRMGISKATIPNTEYDRSTKQLTNVKYLNYSGSMITNDAKRTREIKSRIAMAKAAFNRKKTYHQQTGFTLKQRFSTYGPRTTGGPRRWCRWSADMIKKYHKASGK
jgi:hypothetical protein